MSMASAIPEFILAGGGLLLLLVGSFRKGSAMQVMRAAILLIAVTITVLLLEQVRPTDLAFNNTMAFDPFSVFGKILVLAATAVVLAISPDYLQRNGLMKAEYPVLFIFAALGMMVMVSASDLIALYLGLELQSLSLYVLAAFRRDALRSTEAGLKYFVLGALSSGLLLYGASLVYGYTGSTRFDLIAEAIAAEGASIGLVAGIAFLCAGLAFKISAVPFHMWTPDAYEGAPSPVTAFFASAPKVAAMLLFARLLHEPFVDAVADWQQIIIFLSVASMIVGAAGAIGQNNIKRLMAYSSIGHMGYALIGIAAGTEEGIRSLLIYLPIYLVMNLGVFSFIVMMTRGGATKVRLSDLSGLSQTHPAAAFGIALLMFSMAGVPPLVGFFGKFFVFQAAIDAGLVLLALAGVVASVVAAFYYLRIVKLMYFDDPGEERLDERMGPLHRLVLYGAALLMSTGWLPFLNGLGLLEASAVAAASLFS